jgi:proteasome lid subunit RPN8/RPN11
VGIKLRQSDFSAIVSHARAKLPNEACGLIAGTAEGETKTICKVYFLANTDHSPEHFSLEPKEQFAALKDARANGWELLGNWHSHPATPARPSAEDIRLAFDPKASYLILSLAGEAPVLKGFHIERGEVTPEPVEII